MAKISAVPTCTKIGTIRRLAWPLKEKIGIAVRRPFFKFILFDNNLVMTGGVKVINMMWANG